MIFHMITQCTRLALTVAGIFSMATGAHAQGHYVPGVEGMESGTVPPPGFYYAGYWVNYRIGSMRAPGTDTNLPGSNKATITALTNRFIWVQKVDFLGADWGMDLIVPVARSSFRMDTLGLRENHSGVGDVYVSPLGLAWHGDRWDAGVQLGLWLDSASADGPADIGKGFKTWMLSAGATYYFDTAKTWSVAAMTRTERNGRNDQGFRNGNQFTVEWALGKRFGVMQVGLVGYSQVQVSHDSGLGASQKKGSRHGLGVEFNYAFPAQKINLKTAVYKDYGVEAGTGPQPSGSTLRLALYKAF